MRILAILGMFFFGILGLLMTACGVYFLPDLDVAMYGIGPGVLCFVAAGSFIRKLAKNPTQEDSKPAPQSKKATAEEPPAGQ